MTLFKAAWGQHPESGRAPRGKVARRVVITALCSVLTLIAQPYAQVSAETLQTIQTRGAWVVGSDVPYGVMEFYDDAGTLTGIDIEIAREISKDLDVTLDVHSIAFDKLFDALDAGEIDAIVSAVTITPERQDRMLFSAPYMDAGMLIAVRADNTDIQGEPDLAGRRVGVLRGTVGADLMAKSAHVADEDLIQYESNEQRLADLDSGDLDAVIVHFAADAVPGIRFVQPPLTQSFYGIVVRLSDAALMARIDASLREMKRSGKLDDIKNRFINTSMP